MQANLAAAKGALEAAVPTFQDGEGAWGHLDGPWWIKISWQRDPFSMTASGNTIIVRTKVNYELRIGWGPHHIVEVAQCGHREPPGSMLIGINTTITPKSDWSFNVSPQLDGPYAVAPCKLTAVGIDVSGHVVDVVKNIVSNQLGNLAGNINGQLQFRDKAAAEWKLAQAPYQFAPNFYFVAKLDSANLSTITSTSDTVFVAAGAEGTDQVVLSATSPPSNPTDLPPLQMADKPDQLSINLPVSSSYDELSEHLNSIFAGHEYRLDGRAVMIKSIRVFGSSDKLIIQADIKLSPWGSATIYLIGLPRYDPLRRQIYVTSLDYDVNSKNLIIDFFAFILQTDILHALQQQSTYDLGPQLDLVTTKATSAINRPLGDHGELSGKFDSVSPVGIGLSDSGLTVYVTAHGHAKLAIH